MTGPGEITASPERLFCGGGGGGASGDDPVPDAAASSGQSGGGIIYIRARAVQVTTGFIRANGGGFIITSSEGGGGGGAGGSIVLHTDGSSFGNLPVQARGADGIGMTGVGDGGGGGGGGGGIFLITTTANATNITGGDGGFALDGGAFQGTDGTDGLVQNLATAPGVTQCIFNQRPVLGNDTATVDEDNQVNFDVGGNDSDPDGDALNNPTIQSGPSNGAVVVEANGTLTYTPNAEFSGTDSFVYEVCDVRNACQTATVNITVNPINDTPVALDDSAATDEDISVAILILDNDVDVDGDNLTPTITGAPSLGTANVNANGSVTYIPDNNVSGTDTFEYTVCDPSNACDTATVTVVITGQNDRPSATDDTDTVAEDGTVVIDVLDNDNDVDGDALTTGILTPPSNGTAVVLGDNTVRYTPNNDFFGNDTFSYQACDPDGLCDSALVVVTVTPVNDAPVAGDDVAFLDEDVPQRIPVLTNDVDVDGDALTVAIVTPPGTGTAIVNADNTITFTPAENFNGAESLVYEVCDPSNVCDTATLTLVITPVNDAPIARNDVETTNEDAFVNVSVLDNDEDPDGDALTVSPVSQPSNGTAVAIGTALIRYTPNPNFAGDDVFTYQSCDPSGACDVAIVNVTVTPVNDAPVATDDVANTDEDVPVVIPVLANDVDVDGDVLTVSISTPPAVGTAVAQPDGTVRYVPPANFSGAVSFVYEVCDPSNACDTAQVNLTIDGVNDVPVANNDTANTLEDIAVLIDVTANDIDADGDTLTPSVASAPSNGVATVDGNQIRYTPAAGFSGADSFTVEVCDPAGACDTSVVNVTVDPVNGEVLALDDTATVDEDDTIAIDVLGNDTDADGDPLTPSITTPPTSGTAEVLGDGTIRYTPNADFAGEDTFVYEACDPSNACDAALVTVTVTPVNDAPVAADDAFQVTESQSTTLAVLDNDSDVDGDVLTPSISAVPTSGTATVNGDGTVTYTPDDDFPRHRHLHLRSVRPLKRLRLGHGDRCRHRQ